MTNQLRLYESQGKYVSIANGARLANTASAMTFGLRKRFMPLIID
jgi:hypothetical protein